MTEIKAIDFTDYFDQSLYENNQFVEDIENTISEALPSSGSVTIDYETTGIAYDKNENTIDRGFTWSADLEKSDLTLYGKIKVRARFIPRGTKPAVLEFVHAWDYEDDIAD